MFLAYLRDNRERYNEAVRRGDDLQERLTREQRECLERLNREQREAQDKLAREERDHAVTKTNLTNAGTRTAAQMLLQILGGAVFGWGLSEMSKTWAALLYLVIAVVLIAIGCMPIVTIPWWRRDRG
jgi:F0F1-type ATP synthase assembly protein I